MSRFVQRPTVAAAALMLDAQPVTKMRRLNWEWCECGQVALPTPSGRRPVCPTCLINQVGEGDQ